jgi:hypothetical protein
VKFAPRRLRGNHGTRAGKNQGPLEQQLQAGQSRNESMSHIQQPSPQGKAIQADTSGERDLILSSLRVAATRSRLQTNLFDSVGIALRQKQIDCAGALAWLRDEGLLDCLPFGPGVTHG